MREADEADWMDWLKDDVPTALQTHATRMVVSRRAIGTVEIVPWAAAARLVVLTPDDFYEQDRKAGASMSQVRQELKGFLINPNITHETRCHTNDAGLAVFTRSGIVYAHLDPQGHLTWFELAEGTKQTSPEVVVKINNRTVRLHLNGEDSTIVAR